MELNEKIAEARKRRELTQDQLATKLYVTRQAVSRWERGEVVPSIDMLKLIATVLDEPIMQLLDMPERYCESCGMILSPSEYGTDETGQPNEHYCKWCYEQGSYTYDTTMDEMIEDCAPRLAKNTGISEDEAVSLMGAVLPHLKRWSAVHANEMRYGKEMRKLYGDTAVDAANNRLLDMSDDEWKSREQLEGAIINQLEAVLENGSADCAEARKLAEMHAQWIRMQWAEGAYTKEAHKALAQGYLTDQRFVDYYDSRAGEGATNLLVEAIESFM